MASGQLRLDTPRKLETVRPNLGQGQATCVPPVDPSFKEMIDQLATGQQILAAETSMLASAGLRAAPYAGGLPLPPNGPYGMQSPPKVPSGLFPCGDHKGCHGIVVGCNSLRRPCDSHLCFSSSHAEK
ncbi:hypothetical protein M513_05465 [Trichuris suis]|uniref:Uncharacterized protein n=1 Tax=Trichuris suis TaxID=68888 RepID=A0A085M8K3_9BILA|nr:hypothetical protein M513_05465 [Trichuris suis]